MFRLKFFEELRLMCGSKKMKCSFQWAMPLWVELSLLVFHSISGVATGVPGVTVVGRGLIGITYPFNIPVLMFYGDFYSTSCSVNNALFYYVKVQFYPLNSNSTSSS